MNLQKIMVLISIKEIGIINLYRLISEYKYFSQKKTNWISGLIYNWNNAFNLFPG